MNNNIIGYRTEVQSLDSFGATLWIGDERVIRFPGKWAEIHNATMFNVSSGTLYAELPNIGAIQIFNSGLQNGKYTLTDSGNSFVNIDIYPTYKERWDISNKFWENK